MKNTLEVQGMKKVYVRVSKNGACFISFSQYEQLSENEKDKEKEKQKRKELKKEINK
jgi:hypothetical protein